MCPRGSCCGRQLEPRPEANQSTRFRQARRSCDGSPATIRGGGNPTLNMALAPRFRMGPPPRSSPPMRTSASWVRTHAVRRIQGCGALALPQGGLPSGRRCASRVPAPAQPLSANQHPEERPCSALDRSSPIQGQAVRLAMSRRRRSGTFGDSEVLSRRAKQDPRKAVKILTWPRFAKTSGTAPVGSTKTSASISEAAGPRRNGPMHREAAGDIHGRPGRRVRT